MSVIREIGIFLTEIAAYFMIFYLVRPKFSYKLMVMIAIIFLRCLSYYEGITA